jgi:hypothetical protein
MICQKRNLLRNAYGIQIMFVATTVIAKHAYQWEELKGLYLAYHNYVCHNNLCYFDYGMAAVMFLVGVHQYTS